MSNCSASSARVFSPLTAARATFALNAAVWFLRGRLLICSPLLSHLRLPKNRTPTYTPVRICGTGSHPKPRPRPPLRPLRSVRFRGMPYSISEGFLSGMGTFHQPRNRQGDIGVSQDSSTTLDSRSHCDKLRTTVFQGGLHGFNHRLWRYIFASG